MAEDVLYIGIDLGTFRSVMVSSDSHEEEELTVIGTPKDPIARNFLKRDVLFGEEALKNRLALNLFRPLELGVIKDTQEDREFIAHFITHLIGLSDPEEYDRVVAVIGAPAEASYVDKTAIFDAAAGSVNAAMIISEPFAVAYALDMIEHTLVIDIGAGTADLCRVYGTIPGPDDQMHTGHAGDFIDRANNQEHSIQVQRCSNHQGHGSPMEGAVLLCWHPHPREPNYGRLLHRWKGHEPRHYRLHPSSMRSNRGPNSGECEATHCRFKP